MIKNEREYKINTASIKRFESSLADLAKLRREGKIDPKKIKLQEAASKSILDELRAAVKEYETLRSGGFELSTLDLIQALPKNLIRARISVGWTQRDLAQRLKTTEQQVQKYEASDYESASLKRIAEIVAILQKEAGRSHR